MAMQELTQIRADVQTLKAQDAAKDAVVAQLTEEVVRVNAESAGLNAQILALQAKMAAIPRFVAKRPGGGR